jgi:hypothetical protein
MKQNLLYVSASVCFVVAGYLAVQGIDGWGWFLLVGGCVATAPFNNVRG